MKTSLENVPPFSISTSRLFSPIAIKANNARCLPVVFISATEGEIAVPWTRSVFIPVPKKGNAKECSNYHTIAFISHASKIMFKILQARLQQYVNREFPDVQTSFIKGRGTRDPIANIHGSWKKQESSRKTSISALLTMPKPLTVWITINCGKF